MPSGDPKAGGGDGEGPLFGNLEEAALGGGMLVYLLWGLQGLKLPCGTGGLFTQEGGKERETKFCSPCSEGGGRGVLGPAALVLGFRWKLRTPVYPGDREMGSVLVGVVG